MHRFPRKLDKENYLETQYTTAKTPPTGKAPLTPSNHQLRKKMDESLAAFERSNGSGKQRQDTTSTSRCKRQRAKNQQFNRKVSSIASINQKITSLLDMVRKDKVGRINTTVVQTQQSDSPIVALKQVRKQFPLVSAFIKNKVDVSKQDDHKLKESITSDPTTRIVLNSQHESLKEMSIKQLKKKYMPEPSNNIHEKSYKLHSSFSIQQDLSGAKGKGTDYLSRILERGESEDSFATEKRNIDQILEDRKIKREKDHQERKDKFSKEIITQQSYIKSRFTQGQKTQNQSSFKFETSIYEDDKDYKTNSTTRLIDEQIKRIKSKIGNNQSFTQKSHVNQNDAFGNESNNRKMNNNKSQKQYTSSIAMKLSIQVDYDNQLRPVRMAFDKISGEEKWDKLQKQLQRTGMKMSIQYIKQLMRVSADQHNPFSEDKSENTKDIVELFISAQRNWENEVSACITAQEMKAEKINPAQIDLTRKGCLSVEDIVCFVNLNTGSFYRNRDLALVFRRFQLGAGETGSTITFRAFQQTFTK